MSGKRRIARTTLGEYMNFIAIISARAAREIGLLTALKRFI